MFVNLMFSVLPSLTVPLISELIKDPCLGEVIHFFCPGKETNGDLKPGAIVGIVLVVVFFLVLSIIGILTLIGILYNHVYSLHGNVYMLNYIMQTSPKPFSAHYKEKS